MREILGKGWIFWVEEKWLVEALNDKRIINEILKELSAGSALYLVNKMKTINLEMIYVRR